MLLAVGIASFAMHRTAAIGLDAGMRRVRG